MACRISRRFWLCCRLRWPRSLVTAPLATPFQSTCVLLCSETCQWHAQSLPGAGWLWALILPHLIVRASAARSASLKLVGGAADEGCAGKWPVRPLPWSQTCSSCVKHGPGSAHGKKAADTCCLRSWNSGNSAKYLMRLKIPFIPF